MDLKIEHIAPYLPSSLKVIMEGKKTDIAWISTKHIVVIRPDGSGDIKKILWKHAAINVKFVLKSLFELRLYQKEIKALGYRIDGNNFLNLMSDIESGVAGYDLMQFCFKNHIDVFRLIEKGFAVNANEVKSISTHSCPNRC